MYPLVEFAALLVTVRNVTLEPDRVVLATQQPNCPAPILFSQFSNTGFFYNTTSGNNVLGQVTATCNGVTSTFECEISRVSKRIDSQVVQTIEAYYCYAGNSQGYLLVTYNPDGSDNTGFYSPGQRVGISSENVRKSLNEYVRYERPTTPPTRVPTLSPTVPVGTGTLLVPNYDSCGKNWIAVAHSRNGSQLVILEEGRQSRLGNLEGGGGGGGGSLSSPSCASPLSLPCCSFCLTHSTVFSPCYFQEATFGCRTTLATSLLHATRRGRSNGPQWPIPGKRRYVHQHAALHPHPPPHPQPRSDGEKVFAMTATGSVFKSLDFGETWAFASNITTPTLDGVKFTHIACNADASAIYATSSVGQIWKSADGGSSWDASASPDGGSSQEWSSIDVSETGNVVIGTLLAAEKGGGKRDGSNAQRASPLAHTLITHPPTASVHGGYLWVTTNAGTTWTNQTGFASTQGNGKGNWVRIRQHQTWWWWRRHMVAVCRPAF